MKNDKIKKFIKMYLLNTTVCPYCYKKIKLKEDDNVSDYHITCGNCHRQYRASRSRIGRLWLLCVFMFLIGTHILDFAINSWVKVWPIILFLIYVQTDTFIFKILFYRILKEVELDQYTLADSLEKVETTTVKE